MQQRSSKQVTLLVATAASFLTPFMGSSINVALPAIGRDFSASALTLNWISTSYLLAASVFLVPMGRTSDILGRRRVFLVGIATHSVASVLAGLCTSAELVVWCRALQGIGGSMIFGTGMAMLSMAYPAGERGRALGINAAAVYLGASMGPFVGGLVTHQAGWRYLFFLNAVLAGTAFLLGLLGLRGDWKAANKERFDIPGAVLYSMTLVCVMYGLSRLPSPVGWVLVGLGLAMSVAFVNLERRARHPVLDLNLLFRNRMFALSNAAALISYGATAAVGFLLSIYLQYIRGMSPQAAGFVLLCQPVVQAALSPSAGHLSDRVEPRFVTTAGMALTLVGLLALAFVGADTSMTWIVVTLVTIGVGFALFAPPNNNAIMGSVGKNQYGVASATLATVRIIGQTSSMGIVMVLFAAFIGNVQITPQYHGALLQSMRATFLISAGLCVIGVFASLARGKVREEGAAG